MLRLWQSTGTRRLWPAQTVHGLQLQPIVFVRSALCPLRCNRSWIFAAGRSFCSQRHRHCHWDALQVRLHWVSVLRAASLPVIVFALVCFWVSFLSFDSFALSFVAPEHTLHSFEAASFIGQPPGNLTSTSIACAVARIVYSSFCFNLTLVKLTNVPGAEESKPRS